MNRRHFLRALSACAGTVALGPHVSVIAAPASSYRRLLVLVELKGGNDGLNTVVPFADAEYYALRPRIGVARDAVLQLSDQVGLHSALQAMWPLWESRELAVLQGVGYPSPNLSHFRSIEIWNTASGSQEVRQQGWLARAFELAPPPRDFFADGVRVGQGELGPLAGTNSRAIALANVEQFLRQSRMAQPGEAGGKSALGHIMRVDQDIVTAATRQVQVRIERPVATLAEAFLRRGDQHALGNLVADAARVKGNADFGAWNNGGIRTDLPAGPINYGGVHEVSPFGNVLVRIRLRGRDVPLAAEHWVWSGRANSHVSGMTIEFDPAKPQGQRVVRVLGANGVPLDPDRIYSIAINDYMVDDPEGAALARTTSVENSHMRFRSASVTC